MQARVTSFLNTVTQKRVLIPLVGLQLVVGALLGVQLTRLASATGGASILDFSFGYSLDDVRALFDSYGAAGMDIYKRIQLIDLFNPALYSLLLAAVFFLATGKQFSWLVLLPLAVGVLDYVENAFLYAMSMAYPALSETTVGMSNAVSIVKHLVLIATVLVGAGLSVRWLQAKRRSSDKG